MILSSVFTAALSSIAADEVLALPGWNGALPSKHYSGLIPVGNQTGSAGHLHYWLIER